MADIDNIYKSLRLLPDFDGNTHVLTRFINLCDQLVLQYFQPGPGNELSNLALINGILNKISGPAARLINSNGIPENWLGIRSALVNNFADHRDETALYSDLSLQTQGNSTPQEFYERCQNLYSTIMTYISLHESVPTTIEAKRDLYKKLTLQAYLRGLKDPLGCRIRCMRPESIEKAFQFVRDELNTLYLQQRNEGGSRKDLHQTHLKSNAIHLPPNNFVPYNMPFRHQNMPGPSRSFASPNNQGWRPSQPQQMQPPRGPSRTQQVMRALPQNYNPQSNLFRLPNSPQQPQQPFKPRPMSGVSHFIPRNLPPTGHDWRKFGNPPPSNYFKTRELNFNEFDDDYNYNEYEYYPDYDQYYYDYDQYNEHYEPYYTSEEPSAVYNVDEPISTCKDSKDENFQDALKPEKPK